MKRKSRRKLPRVAPKIGEKKTPVKAPNKHPRGEGSPTYYHKKYCKDVVKMGKNGFTPAMMAAEFGVHRATLNQRWAKEHPEFAEAYSLAKELAQAYWESKLHRLMEKARRGDGPRVTATTWYIARRFRGDYHEKSAVEHSGPDGGPMETRELTKEELKERMRERGLPDTILLDR